MAILVTGGTGFIGSHTVVELIQAGKEVVIVDNFSNSKPEVLNRIEKITGTRPTFYEADLLDKPAIDQIFDEQKIDAVIHFAHGRMVMGQADAAVEWLKERNIPIFSPLSKVVLIFDMLAGRLELFPLMILFMPSTWRKK